MKEGGVVRRRNHGPNARDRDAWLKDVPATWWSTDEGLGYIKHRELQSSWASFLEKFSFDCWFTLTFKKPAQSGILAIDRTIRLIETVSKKAKINVSAFVVAEAHKNGSYHSHGLMRIGALTAELERIILKIFWEIGVDMFGRNSFALVRDSAAVRVYVSKYLTKQPADHRFYNVHKCDRAMQILSKRAGDCVSVMRLMAVYAGVLSESVNRKDVKGLRLARSYGVWACNPSAVGAFDELRTALDDFIEVIEDGKR